MSDPKPIEMDPTNRNCAREPLGMAEQALEAWSAAPTEVPDDAAAAEDEAAEAEVDLDNSADK